MSPHEIPPPRQPEDSLLLDQIYRLFRTYFDRAEKKDGRWSLAKDIPWQQCNPALNPAIADVVETFCSVELYLPDYLSKLIPQVRANRGRAWFLANWGYEECKHSLALGDWLLRSGQRTDEQMADLEGLVFAQEWDLPHDTACGMVCYTMMQELATWVHYQNLRKLVQDLGGDPALERVLTLIGIDERAHYDFFRQLVRVYLASDPRGTLEQIRRVLHSFRMPAVHLLVDSARRVAAVASLRIFDHNIFYFQVVEPFLADLGLTKARLRSCA